MIDTARLLQLGKDADDYLAKMQANFNGFLSSNRTQGGFIAYVDLSGYDAGRPDSINMHLHIASDQNLDTADRWEDIDNLRIVAHFTNEVALDVGSVGLTRLLHDVVMCMYRE